MKKIFILLLLTAVGVFFYYKTGPAKEKEAIGRWQTAANHKGVYGSMLVVLGQDKRFQIRIIGTKAGQPVSLDVQGDWRIIANNLKLTVEKSSSPQLAAGTVMGGRLVRLDQQQMVYKTTSGEEVLHKVRGIP